MLMDQHDFVVLTGDGMNGIWTQKTKQIDLCGLNCESKEEERTKTLDNSLDL